MRMIAMIPAFGKMRLAQRPAQISHFRPFQQRLRQRIRNLRRPFFDKRLDNAPEQTRAQPFRHAIDRHDANRMQVFVVELLPFGIGHLLHIAKICDFAS